MRFSAGNVVCLAEDEVVADSSGRGDTIRELEKSGVKVHGMDLSEFRKGAGGPASVLRKDHVPECPGRVARVPGMAQRDPASR